MMLRFLPFWSHPPVGQVYIEFPCPVFRKSTGHKSLILALTHSLWKRQVMIRRADDCVLYGKGVGLSLREQQGRGSVEMHTGQAWLRYA